MTGFGDRAIAPSGRLKSEALPGHFIYDGYSERICGGKCVMAELIGFLIVFVALALVIGAIAPPGAIRIVAFSILAALAVIMGSPIIRQQFQPAIQNIPSTLPSFPANDSPLSLLPFIVVFGAMAALVGTLIKDATFRLIGFGIVTALALIVMGTPLRQQLASISVPFVNQAPSAQSGQSAQQVPNQAPGQGSEQIPSNYPSGTQAPASIPGGSGGTADSIPSGSIQPANPATPANQQRRGVPALW